MFRLRGEVDVAASLGIGEPLALLCGHAIPGLRTFPGSRARV